MSMRARAVWFASERRAEIRTEDIRACGPGEITVKTLVSGVSSGTEMLIYRGRAPRAWKPEPAETTEGSVSFPIKFAYSNVGRVVAAGKDAPYRVGDLVFALFPHQDLYTIKGNSQWVRKIPEPRPLEIGIFHTLLSVAVNIFLDVPIRVGETVVVFGQGVVGMFCAQLAQKIARRVIVVDPIPMRRDMAREFGAHCAVHPDDARAAIEEATSGRGADVIVEVSGSPTALQMAIESAAYEGSIVVASWYGSQPVALDLGKEFHVRRLRLVSSQVAGINSRLLGRWSRDRRGTVVSELLETVHAKEMITHRFPFERAPEAYRLIDERPDAVLSVALLYDRGEITNSVANAKLEN